MKSWYWPCLDRILYMCKLNTYTINTNLFIDNPSLVASCFSGIIIKLTEHPFFRTWENWPWLRLRFECESISVWCFRTTGAWLLSYREPVSRRPERRVWHGLLSMCPWIPECDDKKWSSGCYWQNHCLSCVRICKGS